MFIIKNNKKINIYTNVNICWDIRESKKKRVYYSPSIIFINLNKLENN